MEINPYQSPQTKYCIERTSSNGISNRLFWMLWFWVYGISIVGLATLIPIREYYWPNIPKWVDISIQLNGVWLILGTIFNFLIICRK